MAGFGGFCPRYAGELYRDHLCAPRGRTPPAKRTCCSSPAC